jgi:hypothetical protein
MLINGLCNSVKLGTVTTREAKLEFLSQAAISGYRIFAAGGPIYFVKQVPGRNNYICLRQDGTVIGYSTSFKKAHLLKGEQYYL